MIAAIPCGGALKRTTNGPPQSFNQLGRCSGWTSTEVGKISLREKDIMPIASRIVSEWMLVGFHLGRALDAFDPDNGLPGDELLRAMLLRRLAAVLTSAQTTRSITSNSGQEAEDLERLWAEQRTQYSPSTLSDDPTDCRLVLVHQGLLRIEAWLRACDDVFEPASSTKLGFDLGIELGHSFAVWPSSTDDLQQPAAWENGDSVPDWSGWGFRNRLKVLELAWRLDFTPVELTALPFCLPFLVTDRLLIRRSDAQMYPPHRWAWGVIEQRLAAIHEQSLFLEKKETPAGTSPKQSAESERRPRPKAVVPPKSPPKRTQEDQQTAGGKLEHLGLEWHGLGTVIRTGYSTPIRIEQNQPWRLFLLYASVGSDWLSREAIKAEWMSQKIGRVAPNNHSVENANFELKKYLRDLALTIQCNGGQDEQEFAYRIEPINGPLDE